MGKWYDTTITARVEPERSSDLELLLLSQGIRDLTLDSCRTFTIVSEEEMYCLLTWDGQSKYGAVEYNEDTVAELKDLLRNNGFSHVELEINTIIPEENLFTLKVEE